MSESTGRVPVTTPRVVEVRGVHPCEASTPAGPSNTTVNVVFEMPGLNSPTYQDWSRAMDNLDLYLREVCGVDVIYGYAKDRMVLAMPVSVLEGGFSNLLRVETSVNIG